MLLNNLNRDVFKPFRSHRGSSVDLLVACLRINAGLKGDSCRETHLWEHFGRTDTIALITHLKEFNISGASLIQPHSCQTYGLHADCLSRKRRRRLRQVQARGWVLTDITKPQIEENHRNPGRKPQDPQITGLEIPDTRRSLNPG